MLALRDALPNPMCFEATLHPPTAQILTTTIATAHRPTPHVINWTEAPPSVHRDRFNGPDGELWLPKDPFHSYEGPSVFGTSTTWFAEQPRADDSPANPTAVHPTEPQTTQTTIESPTLSSDVENTCLPTGLLDSPTRPGDDEGDNTGIQSLCATLLTAPPTAVLPAPAPTPTTPTPVAVATLPSTQLLRMPRQL
jgi:hypothetical protein